MMSNTPAVTARKTAIFGATAVAAIILILNLAFTIRFIQTKRPEQDEGLFANPSYDLKTNGTFGTTMVEPANPFAKGLDKVTYWTVPLHLVTLAGWFKIFGFSLAAQRSLSAFWGALAVLSWFVIVRSLFKDTRLALLTSLLIGVDHALVSAASCGRMEMMSASLNYAALAAYVSLRERRLDLAFLAGYSAVVASGLSHPVGGVLSFCGVTVAAFYMDRKRFSLRCLAFAALPFVVGAAGWGLFIARHPDYFLAQFGFNLGFNNRLSGVHSPLGSFPRELRIILFKFFGITDESSRLAAVKLLIPAAYLAAMAGVWFDPELRRNRGARLLLLWALAYFGALALVDNGQRIMYLIHLLLIFPAILAVWAGWTWRARSRLWMIAAALATVAFGLQLSRNIHTIQRNPYVNTYLPSASSLLGRVGPRTTVIGPPEMAYAIGFDRLIVDHSLAYYSGKRPDLIMIEKIDQDEYAERSRLDPAFGAHLERLLHKDYQLVSDAGYTLMYAIRPVAAPESAR